MQRLRVGDRVVGGHHPQHRLRASSATSRAAAAIAGALLRPTGSSTMRASGMPAARSCSAIRKRCSWLQTTIGGAKAGAGGAQGGLLDQRAVGDQRPELLGEALARHRPEPGAGAAGEDDGKDPLIGQVEGSRGDGPV